MQVFSIYKLRLYPLKYFLNKALRICVFAINFYIKGVLGEGVAASVRNDPQAKTLGEYLRAKVIEVPGSVIEATSV